MKRVWVVTDGCYSDFHVVGVYSTKRKADRRVELLGPDGMATAYTLDQRVDTPPRMKAWRVTITYKGEIYAAYPVDAEGFEPQGLSVGYKNRNAAVSMWARDKKHAIKIAAELRAQAIATGKWGVPEDLSLEENLNFSTSLPFNTTSGNPPTMEVRL